MNLVQFRMAQSAMNRTVRELAKAAGVKVLDIQAFMRGSLAPPEVIARLRHAFEESGLVFVDEDPNGDGVGVRLRKIAAGGDHLKPSGPATDAVERMETEIAADRQKPKRRP